MDPFPGPFAILKPNSGHLGFLRCQIQVLPLEYDNSLIEVVPVGDFWPFLTIFCGFDQKCSFFVKIFKKP